MRTEIPYHVIPESTTGLLVLVVSLTMDEVLIDMKALAVDTKKIQQNDEEETVVYDVGYEQEPFDKWLEDNMPSVIRSDKADFVGVLRDNQASINKPESDVMGLMNAFTRVIASDRELVTKQLLFSLAEKFHVTSGKWMLIPVKTGLKVDVLWTKVAKAIAEAQIPCHYAKVSTMNADKLMTDPSHVICIYNNNFLNLDEVRALESGIRSIGLRGKLCYKPDVYTYCGIYSRNQWGISPIISKSNYDIKLEKSRIELF
ncbi:UPF0696 protein C11orf68 homolog [Mizuhopecten yessoensis]|uniref:UPF0696 protein C11orf68 homolog n=1 Tax=Mizuhopecten yessoensis TaxID=6573 RepID=UPI000B45F853|nr:UPF0696 protein C11orf68 homolog [Mizuhopecten yessoensis]